MMDGILTRNVTFSLFDSNRVRVDGCSAPAGTYVYVTGVKGELVNVRIPGSLFTQRIKRRSVTFL